MIIDTKKFFTYIEDCNRTLPPNPQYDEIIKKLVRGESIEVIEGGLVRYMYEDNGKIIFLTKTYNA